MAYISTTSGENVPKSCYSDLGIESVVVQYQLLHSVTVLVTADKNKLYSLAGSSHFLKDAFPWDAHTQSSRLLSAGALYAWTVIPVVRDLCKIQD